MTNYHINHILPHRFPFLLLDKIIECEPGIKGKAVKNFTINEPFFVGHFPNDPVVPGVIIIECCAQLVGVICYANKTTSGPPAISYLTSVKEFNLRKKVLPGDQMLMEAKISLRHQNFLHAQVKAYIGKTVVADGLLAIATADKNKI